MGVTLGFADFPAFVAREPAAATVREGGAGADEAAFQAWISPHFKALRLDPGRWHGLSDDLANSNAIPLRQRLLAALESSLPGGVPELGVFLDEGRFAGPLDRMREAWAGRPMSEVPAGNNLDAYLAGLRGRTLLLVGHIENGDFVMEQPDNPDPPRHNLLHLIQQAQKHGVLLLPLGCESAQAGAPIGVMRNIGTDEVVSILRHIPADGLRVADLVRPLEGLGVLEVRVASLVDALEIAVRGPGDGFDRAATRFLLPNAPVQSVAANDAAFRAFAGPWLAARLAWYDRVPFALVSVPLREEGGWIALAWLGVLFTLIRACEARWLRARRSRAWIARLLRQALIAVTLAGLAILAVVGMYYIVEVLLTIAMLAALMCVAAIVIAFANPSSAAGDAGMERHNGWDRPGAWRRWGD